MSPTMRWKVAMTCVAMVALGCARDGAQSAGIATPSPRRASQPVPVNRVNDAAIWVNPLDASRSRIVITNAERGVEVHDLDGVLLKHLDHDFQTDSITILHDFELKGEKVDLVLATYPDKRTAGVRMWFVDAANAKLKDVPGTFAVPGNDDPLGIAAFKSKVSGKCYVFVTSVHGVIDQLEIASDEKGVVSAKPVRQLKLECKAQGCIVDEVHGAFYACEEKLGVWKFDAEPTGSTSGERVIKAGEHGLVGDVEGIALYEINDTADHHDGYLIVVGQGEKAGSSRLNVYDQTTYAFAGAIVPKALDGNPVDFTSGIDVTSANLPGYPGGLLVVKDRTNPNASEDFKFYAWNDVAKSLHLKMSPTTRRVR